MKEDGERTIIVELTDVDATDSGIFTWDIVRDLVYGDSALAALFGLAASETSQGLPLRLYLDRATEKIVSGRAQQSFYRVRTRAGLYVSVVAFGRCFQDRDGTPVLYSGIVVLESATSTNDNRRH